MDELMIVCRVGELIDHGLGYGAPGRDANFVANTGQKLVERDRLHGCRFS
jgi:hypothetical protein